ncbi:glutamate-rich protein 6-like isoform X2 [Rhinoraja longicauda]
MSEDDQRRQGRQHNKSGSSRYPSILNSFTPEESLTDCDLDDKSDYNSSSGSSLCLLDSYSENLAAHERPLTSILTQTDSSWLLGHGLEETGQDEEMDAEKGRAGSESSEKESVSTEDNLSDSNSKASLEDFIIQTEFINQLKPGRFGSCLYTLPSIGLPTILAYKYESKEKQIDYAALSQKVMEMWLQNVKELGEAENYSQWARSKAESIGFTHCQFCGKRLKPPPTRKQLSEGSTKDLFCCKEYEELFKYLIEVEEHLNVETQAEQIDIAPHGPYGTLVEREKAKEKVAMRLHNRTVEKYIRKERESARRYPSGAKKNTTIAFQLSTSTDVGQRIKTTEDEDVWDDIFTEVVDDTFSWHKDLPLSFLVKNYKNGNTFLTTFADGTAQIFYPSGNLAIMIFIDKEKKVTCIVQEDKDTEPAIRAIFTSYGRCTCYHPNGVVWVNTNGFGGHFADEHGTRLRRWFWRDCSLPLVFAPLKPIFISLNINIGVRIIEQQRILLTFLAMGKQAKFNLGSILKFKTSSMQTITNSWVTDDDRFLQTSWIKVQTIINKLCIALNFPSNDPEKIGLPLYLVTQQQKLSRLYADIKMEESIHEENVA